jgi:hypothetical protein
MQDGMDRRDFMKSMGAGAAAAAMGAGAADALGAEKEVTMASGSALEARAFGARGDGQADDTAAVQKALAAAAEVHGTVFFPAGTYLCSEVRVPAHVGLAGEPTWGYRHFGGAILKLADAKATCLLNLTGAIGATVTGLCLDGGALGEHVHGILVDKPDYGREEDTPRIERCRIASFSGDGIRLGRIWCFTVRHCMSGRNGGCGLRLRGWDGFILDNWFSGNREAGFGAYDENASTTVTGNRIEWNRQGGIVIHGGDHYNFGNNYIDRSGGPGISLLPRGDRACYHISITGTCIWRSGKREWPTSGEEHQSAQVRFECVRGLTFTGNAMMTGRDDNSRGEWSPDFGVVYGRLENSVIMGNVLHSGALKELLVDLGGHGPNVIVRDNPGSLGFAT